MAALTREEGINHLTYELCTRPEPSMFSMTEAQLWDFYQPQAESLYDIFTSTTPQTRFPQPGVNMIRLNAQFNPTVTKSFLDRQFALWRSGQWVVGLTNRP